MDNKMDWYLEWPAIIVAALFFWPVAVFLLYKRSQVSKEGMFNLNAGKVMKIVGWSLIAFGIMTIMLAVGIFFIIGGATVLVMAKKAEKDAERYRKYISMIVNQHETSIPKMASLIGETPEAAQKDIQTLIDKGALAGATIDYATGNIRLPTRQVNVQQQQSVNHLQMNVKNCPGCGANVEVLEGQTIHCEYCGSPIKG